MDAGRLERAASERKVTFGSYLERWLKEHASSRVRQRTLEGYRGSLERYVIPRLGRVPLERLRARDLQELELELLGSGGVRGDGLSPRTVLQVHRVISSALRTAEVLGLVSSNVARLVEPPRVVRHEAHTLTWEEAHRFLEQVDDPLYQALFLVALQTGLRRSELLGLQWRDVDLDAATVSVRRALVKLPSGTAELTAPKAGRGRMLEFPPESLDALRMRWLALGRNGDFVFCHSSGSPLDPDAVTQKFKRVAQRSGLGHLRLHDLRHTHASLMLAQGTHLKVVSERLGHASIGITGDLYSHVQPTVQSEAVQRFGEAWSVTEKRNGERNGKWAGDGSECP
jgi:integrase